jgi:hypothetical protein
MTHDPRWVLGAVTQVTHTDDAPKLDTVPGMADS